MATKVKDTLSHADKFKEFGLFRDRTTLVFTLFSDSEELKELALIRFIQFLTEDMNWEQTDASVATDCLEVSSQYEVTKDGVSIVISSIHMDNSLVIHYNVYHYEN